jgi:hypothetical protein
MPTEIHAKATLPQRAVHEFREFAILTVYLYITLGAVVLMKTAVLHTEGIEFAPWGIAVVKAAVFKVAETSPRVGLVLKAVPAANLDEEVDALAHRIASVPQNQLMMQKLMVNQALANMGLQTTQMLATLFDGITRHTREGLNFKRRAGEEGWKQAVEERDQGTFDWTTYEPIKSNR